LSNSFSTMSKCPFWQAVYKGDAPSSIHLSTSVLTLSRQVYGRWCITFIYCLPEWTFRHCRKTIRQC
jgi:hypothetical protein